MLTVLIPLEALNVPATGALREMESTAQVSLKVCYWCMKVKKQMTNNLIVQCSILCVYTVFCITVIQIFFSSCSDINECESGSLNEGDENADCFDTIGGYNCSCKSGHEGDGFNCTGYTSMCGA